MSDSATDAPAPVAKGARTIAAEVDFPAAGIQDNEIIAEAVHFGEP